MDAGDGTHARVLVVEDERVLADAVARFLAHAGYATRIVGDGLSAVEEARRWRPDVIVLDLNLPGLDGLEVCRRVRTFSDCYVLMLTARTDEVDQLMGLAAGADDYLGKPFSARTLVARVGVLLRRPRTPATSAPEQPRLVFGPLALDPGAREVTLDGGHVELTRTEFDVLATLAARPRLVFTRRQLSEAVWGDDWVGDEHLVDTHVAHIRQKLGDDATRPAFIRTVRGVGYRMGEGVR